MPQFHCLGPLDVGVVTVYVYFRATVSRPLSKRRLKPRGLLIRVGSRPTPLPFITHAATAPRGLPALQPLFLQPGHWDLWRWTVESQLQKGSCREDILWGLQPHIQKVGGSEIHPAGRQVGVESCRQMMAVPYTVARAHTRTHTHAHSFWGLLTPSSIIPLPHLHSPSPVTWRSRLGPYLRGSGEQAPGVLPVPRSPALPSQPSLLTAPNSTPFLPSRILHPGPAQPNPAPGLALGKWVAPSREPP